MFTGLVLERGTVADIVRNDTSAVITIKAAHLAGQIKPGDSVSVDGVCLTAVDVAPDSFTAEGMPRAKNLPPAAISAGAANLA